ncbi:MAG: c-type cytochrome [Fuerstiella sp.]|nr:c-type cytochrome [Fuerstiella sp.]
MKLLSSLLAMACIFGCGATGTMVIAQTGTLPPPELLPKVPDGFEISVVASEPLLYKPAALCFDANGRIMVGQGPQYHLSESITESDSVVLLLDTDADGIADHRTVFAKGFNSIQGLAWRGQDLYVANSPELTVVRDLDGDDQADEYIVVYTDLGNHEHALHGLVWGPDGRLYMSKGNSKGHNDPEKYGRVAPRAFRELWDVVHPAGAPDIPEPQTYTTDTYQKTFHDFRDDWGREGGILRCGPMGANLEIVSRGMRNPWDLAVDSGFNLLATDNDQTQGDRIIMPFYGAHFGWGHRYSSHWTGEENLPTVPISGPLTSGSWAGIEWYDHQNFPPEYRRVFFINDWMFGTYVYRPDWNGALRTSSDRSLEPFIQRREGGMIYRPTDVAVGPDGAIYTLGWGGNYHYEPGDEGSWIFRVTHSPDSPPSPSSVLPLKQQTVLQLITSLKSGVLPVRRINAQDELVRRGPKICDELAEAISGNKLSVSQQTWAMWAFGRIASSDVKHAETIKQWAVPRSVKSSSGFHSARGKRNLRIQAIRILAWLAQRTGNDPAVLSAASEGLRDTDPRIRLESMQAIHQARLRPMVDNVVEQLAKENDRLVFYAGWQALRNLAQPATRRTLLDHNHARVRLAALLGLQEDYEVTQQEVLTLLDNESDPAVQSWALTFAMNPLPPAKLTNDRLRIVMEQTMPVDQLISRAIQTPRPSLRRLYLKMISRASVSEGQQQQQLLTFYRTLPTSEERALILPSASTTLDAFPEIWDAIGEPEPLRSAGIEGISRLHRRHVRQLRSSESSVRSTSRTLSSISGFAAELANRLFEQLANVDVDDQHVSGALTAINGLPLPKEWFISHDALEFLLTVLEDRNQPTTGRTALRLLRKLDPATVAQEKRMAEVLNAVCKVPNALLFRDLLAVTSHFGLAIDVPVPRASTVTDVLNRLDQAQADRGREIFFDAIHGGGCSACHRVRGTGSELAPDLSGVGIRLTPENVVKAIIQPSAAITEGYTMQLFVDTDGLTYTGAVIHENDSEITILRTDGTQVTIRTESIEERRKLNQSVMPSGYEFYGAEQLADLTAWLLTLRDPGNKDASNADK